MKRFSLILLAALALATFAENAEARPPRWYNSGYYYYPGTTYSYGPSYSGYIVPSTGTITTSSYYYEPGTVYTYPSTTYYTPGTVYYPNTYYTPGTTYYPNTYYYSQPGVYYNGPYVRYRRW